MSRMQELCRRLKPVMGRKIDRLWSAYLAESDVGGKADIEQTLELLAVKHLGADYTGLCVDCDTPLHSCEIEAAGDLCGFCLEARMEKNFNLFDSPDRPNQKPLSASAY